MDTLIQIQYSALISIATLHISGIISSYKQRKVLDQWFENYTFYVMNIANTPTTDVDESKWPETERNQFLSSCVKAGMQQGNSESIANLYCDCAISKLEKKFSNANDITMEVMFKIQEDCKKKISR